MHSIFKEIQGPITVVPAATFIDPESREWD
jgi:hypothetical protein